MLERLGFAIPEDLEDFWALVVSVWQQGFAGVSIGDLIVAALILLVGFALRRLFVRVLSKRLMHFAQKTSYKLDDMLVMAMEPPLAFIPVVIACFLATQSLPLQGTALDLAYDVDRTLVAFALFWLLYSATRPLTEGALQPGRVLTGEMVNWLGKSLKIAILALGAAVILEIWGIKVAPLLAGLGLFGVAVALGAQDLFKNLIAGLFLIAERRFHSGDWIKVEGLVEGTVEQIGFRTTKVRRFDKAPVFVPNSKLSDSAVTNFSDMTHRRIYWKIGVTYDTNSEQLKEICGGIQAYVSENAAFAGPPEVPLFVRVDEFAASSINIMLYCFTRTTVWGEWLEIKEELAHAIKDIVEGAGSSFAFPSTSIYVESLPDPEGLIGQPESKALGVET
ncbi:MAG: mechanosensitive ion channel family protein [Pseudomonadota bacterium]